MMIFKAEKVQYDIVCQSDQSKDVYPLVRNDEGDYTMQCVSPAHGRSFILGNVSQNRWVVGKGNGLSYTTHPFILTSPDFGETWGGLSIENAVRDFNIGNEVRNLGIKTNHMEYVLALDGNIIQNGENRQAALFQYSVECPYRISDFGFIPKHLLVDYVAQWGNKYPLKHLHAAKVIISNLRLLHDHHIMHNAMHPQNYTWALELLDFEASRTDNYPYDNADYEAYVPMLIKIEVIQAYEIINYIAWSLGETPDYHGIECIFNDYGFKLKELNIKSL